MIPARGPQTKFSIGSWAAYPGNKKFGNTGNWQLGLLTATRTCILTHMHFAKQRTRKNCQSKHGQPCSVAVVLNAMHVLKLKSRSLNEYMLCSSVTKLLRDAASVCMASDAL